MDVAAPSVYQPRQARSSPLYRLVQEHFETLALVHEERFQPRYGLLRRSARRAVERFLDCGILEQGFARVRCEKCHAEFLVAFSRKARILCPSCHAKRLEIWADWLEHELLYAVPHRQYVFTVPKRLRPYFLHDRKLLGVLARVAYRTLRDFMRATFREPDVVPGVLASIQTFGSLVNWHPHLHLLVTDGAFRPHGTFLHLGFHDIEILTEAFRRAVLRGRCFGIGGTTQLMDRRRRSRPMKRSPRSGSSFGSVRLRVTTGRDSLPRQTSSSPIPSLSYL